MVICKTRGGKHEWEEELNEAWFICVEGGIYVSMWPTKLDLKNHLLKLLPRVLVSRGIENRWRKRGIKNNFEELQERVIKKKFVPDTIFIKHSMIGHIYFTNGTETLIVLTNKDALTSFELKLMSIIRPDIM